MKIFKYLFVFILSVCSAAMISQREQPIGVYVGELQERWQFPSDHLPIGLRVNDLNFASWNVLDAKYMGWVIEKNCQGLRRSMIADEHLYIGGSSLTVRDQHVVRLILDMLQHTTHPKQLLALQECGDPFLVELKSHLPSCFTVVAHDGNAVVVDTRHFTIIGAKAVAHLFAHEPHRSIQDILLERKQSGDLFRVVNVHLPGDPSQPSREEFTRYLAKTFDDTITTLALGDMNFNEVEMSDALRRAFPNTTPPFALYSPYCTNISPNIFYSKVIDHFMVSSVSRSVVLQPNEVMPGLESVVGLLSP
jgi:endonuclease/exonuclease/phosphatase family metal-dependent hydrolase